MDRRVPHQDRQGGKAGRLHVIGRCGQQPKYGGTRNARADAVTDRKPAPPQALLHVGHDLFIGHPHHDLLGVVTAFEAGDRADHRFRLVRRAFGDLDLRVRERDLVRQPGGRADAAVLVEVIGQFLRREDQRRHAVGHLVEDHPLRPVQVGGADQHDAGFRPTFLSVDRHLPRCLHIP